MKKNTVKLPKYIKRIMTFIKDPAMKSLYKNMMLEAEQYKESFYYRKQKDDQKTNTLTAE